MSVLGNTKKSFWCSIIGNSIKCIYYCNYLLIKVLSIMKCFMLWHKYNFMLCLLLQVLMTNVHIDNNYKTHLMLSMRTLSTRSGTSNGRTRVQGTSHSTKKFTHWVFPTLNQFSWLRARIPLSGLKTHPHSVGDSKDHLWKIKEIFWRFRRSSSEN